MKNSAITINSEWKRREDLIQDPKFRTLCAQNVKKLGVTAKEWNENKSGFLLFFANEFCGIENNN